MDYSRSVHAKYPCAQVVSIPWPKIDKIDFALCNQPTETPDTYYKRQAVKPDIITNGGFFSMSNGSTCFSYKDEEKTVMQDSYPGVAVNGNKSLTYTTLIKATQARDFIAAYPPLIVEGKRADISYAKELDYKARRTCIGWNRNNFFILAVDAPGLAYKALQDIFLDLKADYAINLDGGGSTRMLLNGKRVTSQLYARPVDNVMCVYLAKPQEKILYRVQVGAFSSKTNADKLANELKGKGFADAFVKKIGVFYKVQLGAFSVRLNAERLQDKLLALGYKSFITT